MQGFKNENKSFSIALWLSQKDLIKAHLHVMLFLWQSTTSINNQLIPLQWFMATRIAVCGDKDHKSKTDNLCCYLFCY